MKKAIFFIIIFLVLSVLSQALCETDKDSNRWSGNVNLFLGEKFLDKDNWEPVDEQFEMGILMDLDVKHRWIPFSFALDFLYSRDEADVGTLDLGVGTFYSNVESRIMELDLGIRKIWEAPRNIRPFIGGGLAIINGELKADSIGQSVSDDETGFGMWADIGAYVTLSERFNLGIDARWSKAEVDLFDREAKVGGWHIGALAGMHW
jgi:hypothetical protein